MVWPEGQHKQSLLEVWPSCPIWDPHSSSINCNPFRATFGKRNWKKKKKLQGEFEILRMLSPSKIQNAEEVFIQWWCFLTRVCYLGSQWRWNRSRLLIRTMGRFFRLGVYWEQGNSGSSNRTFSFSSKYLVDGSLSATWLEQRPNPSYWCPFLLNNGYSPLFILLLILCHFNSTWSINCLVDPNFTHQKPRI